MMALVNNNNFTLILTDNLTVNNVYPSSIRSPNSVTMGLLTIILPALGVFIIIMNLAVVISSGLILKTKKYRANQQSRSTYLFLGNVALSDLLTGIAVLFGVFLGPEYSSEFMCSIQIGIIVLAILVSVFSVGLIAVDRFLYILYGLHYQKFIYTNRARLLILITWIVGAIVGFLPAMGWRGDTGNGKYCWYVLIAPPQLILLSTILGTFPILLVAILYSIILYRALKTVKELKKATGMWGTEVPTNNSLRIFRTNSSYLNQSDINSTTVVQQHSQEVHYSYCCWKHNMTSSGNQAISPVPNRNEPTKWKAIKIVMFTTGCFIFTWMPCFIAATMQVYCDIDKYPSFCTTLKLEIANRLFILGFANSLLNPIIYAWWHNGFRQSSTKIFKNTLQQIKCCRWWNRHCNANANLSSTINSRTITEQTSIPSASSPTISTHI